MLLRLHTIKLTAFSVCAASWVLRPKGIQRTTYRISEKHGAQGAILHYGTPAGQHVIGMELAPRAGENPLLMMLEQPD